jgi:hypothetical protein
MSLFSVLITAHLASVALTIGFSSSVTGGATAIIPD